MCAKEDILDGLGKEERSDDCRVSGLLELPIIAIPQVATTIVYRHSPWRGV